MNNLLKILLGVLVLVSASCQKELTPEEYSKYISDPENGLRKNQTVGNFELSVMYEPVDYLLGKSKDNRPLDQQREEFENFEHFQFRIKLTEGGNILMYKETVQKNEVTRIHHFSFEAKRDFTIVSGVDTNYCKFAHFSRNFNLSPTIDLTLAFDKIEVENDWQLIYEDKQFDLGKIKFLFKEDDLRNLPALKL